jgi:uncharacterized protein
MLKTRLLDQEIAYDGAQLRSHFAYDTAGLAGDSMIAFVGACEVRPATMVDREDLNQGNTIRARSMLHFLAEHFGERLPGMVWRQRLFARLAAQQLAAASGRAVAVEGDDLFVAERKASISVATKSPVSGVFHFALNIDPTGAPVPAIGLAELGVEPRALATRLLASWAAEVEDITAAAAKVRWVS